MLAELIPEKLQITFICVREFWKAFHRPLNLIAPKTFSEKVQMRKIADRDPRLPLRSDKILVKDFVRAKLGERWVIPTIWSGKELPPCEERTWPMPFVIKINSGSGWNIFVRSEAECDWSRIEHQCNNWMAQTFGRHLGEWLYSRIEPRILVEPFINHGTILPLDYKLWVFRGRVEFIHVDIDRETKPKRAYFDRDWNRLPFAIDLDGHPRELRDIPRPASLELMIAGAEALAEDLPFVRVDLYEIDGQPLFGEMTFYPRSGFGHFDPPEFDRKIGSLW
jgi:TupA-like ATPgrasp